MFRWNKTDEGRGQGTQIGGRSAESSHHNLLGKWLGRVNGKDSTKEASELQTEHMMSLTGIWEMEEKQGSESIRRRRCLLDQKYPLWKFCSKYYLMLPTFI